MGDSVIGSRPAATASWLPSAISEWLRVGPPGVVFYAATFGAVLLALDANTRLSLGMLVVAAPIWFAMAGIWLMRFVVAGVRARWRLTGLAWARWLLIPMIMGTVFALTRTDLLVEARLGASRGAMNEMAADIMAGGPMDRGWVGLYDVGTVQPTQNGFRFIVDDSGLARWGFAYSPAGEPTFLDDEEDQAGLWQGPTFESIDDGWWRWSQAWD